MNVNMIKIKRNEWCYCGLQQFYKSSRAHLADRNSLSRGFLHSPVTMLSSLRIQRRGVVAFLGLGNTQESLSVPQVLLCLCILQWEEVQTEESVEGRIFCGMGGLRKSSIFLSLSKCEFSLKLRKTREDSSPRMLPKHAPKATHRGEHIQYFLINA